MSSFFGREINVCCCYYRLTLDQCETNVADLEGRVEKVQNCLCIKNNRIFLIQLSQ